MDVRRRKFRRASPATPASIFDSPLRAAFTHGSSKDDRELNVRVNGQLTFNSINPVLQSAVDGLGLAHVREDLAKPCLSDGRLLEILADWCPSFQAYHLFYPNRRHASPAFAAFVDALRYRGHSDGKVAIYQSKANPG